MVDKSQLPYMLKLLDDETGSVREKVTEALLSFGPDLENQVDQYRVDFTAEQLEVLNRILKILRRRTYESNKFKWLDEKDEIVGMEFALQNLCTLEAGKSDKKISILLDDLAKGFEETGRELTPYNLVDYLFKEKKFNGVKKEYYNPLNNVLSHVIESKQGNPISLSCIAILVGHRIGIVLEGCNFPGHFLLSFLDDNKLIIIDGFNGGKKLTDDDIQKLIKSLPEEYKGVFDITAPPSLIVARVIKNLAVSYDRDGDDDLAKYYHELYEELYEEIALRNQNNNILK